MLICTVSKWSKTEPGSPGWMAQYELEEVAAGVRVLDGKYNLPSLVAAYLTEFQKQVSLASQFPGVVDYAVFKDGDTVYTVLAFNNEAQYDSYRLNVEEHPERKKFIATRNEMLIKFDISFEPFFKVPMNVSNLIDVSVDDVKAAIAAQM